MKRSPSEIYAAAQSVGLSSAAATIAVAVALAESGGDDTELGDVSLENNTWGPSVGVWQIRTLKAQTGTGGDRDAQALSGNLQRQALAMRNISSGGINWTPWTTYTRGTYQQFLGQAQTSAVGGSSIVDVSNPLDPSGAVENWIGGQVNAAVIPARNLVIKFTIATLGLAIVGAGLIKAVSPQLKKGTAELQKEAKNAASVAVLAA
jgi:hypothetical protein